MAYWSFRIGVVLTTSIGQFDRENGVHNSQLNVLAKKRMVGCHWNIIVKTLLNRLKSIKLLYYIMTEFSGRNVGNFGDILSVLDALSNVLDVRNISKGRKCDDQANLYVCLLACHCQCCSQSTALLPPR